MRIREGRRMSYLPQFPFARHWKCVLLLWVWAGVSASARAQTPTPPPEAPAATVTVQPPAEPAKPQAPASNDNAEVSSRDTAPTFKVRVNLVLVRVVVRDQQGHVVPNLKKEDFQLTDNRKPQTISTFSVETPESRVIATTTGADAEASADPSAAKAVAAALPQRFVSVVFDDQHLTMQDAMFVRNATGKFFDSLAASDRVGIYSTSGQFTQEFTDDHELLRKSLLKILPHSPTAGTRDCPDISYYQADMIQNKSDAQALAVAMEDTIRRLGSMPGQRIMVFVSPGFIPSTLQLEFSELVDRATKANIVINTIDARGLYTPDLGDITNPNIDPPKIAGYKSMYRVAAQSAQEDVLAQLADGTGGTFFHNRNDVDEGLREAGAAPGMTYLLGFSPQNMKL